MRRVDHRKLQRTLFRMQLDADFARDVFLEDMVALRSTGLEADELALLLAVDLRAVSADAGGRRRLQLVGNVAGEFSRTVHLATARLSLDDFALAFASSSEFHDAIREDRRLPLAFASYASRRIDEVASAADPTRAVFELERAMAEARRVADVQVPAKPLGPGEVVRAPSVALLEVADGTLAFAAEIGAADDAGQPAPTAPTAPTLAEGEPISTEVLLLTTRPPRSGRRGGLSEVEVERLSRPAAALIRALERPLDVAGRAALASEFGAEPADLEAFVVGLVADGVLRAG